VEITAYFLSGLRDEVGLAAELDHLLGRLLFYVDDKPSSVGIDE
jgi:hypothetical protein